MRPNLQVFEVAGREDINSTVREWLDAVCRAWNLRVDPASGLKLTPGSGGRTLSMSRPWEPAVLLSGSANPYTGVPVYPTANGNWANVGGGVTLTGIYEDDARTGLGGQVVWISPRRDGAANWRFRFVKVAPTSSSTLVTTPGCPCASSPATIFQTHIGSPVGWFNPPLYDDTYDWGTHPITGGTWSYYLARTTRTDSGKGTAVPYNYQVSCVTGSTLYALRRLFVDGTVDPINYTWDASAGHPGNQCSPTWEMTYCNGNVGYPSFQVYLNG